MCPRFIFWAESVAGMRLQVILDTMETYLLNPELPNTAIKGQPARAMRFFLAPVF
jgi:hypothetical protein